MKHDWVDYSEGVKDISYYGRRRCLNCGKIQSKESEQHWMRVVGYRWYPLAGRCKLSPITIDEVRAGDLVEFQGSVYKAVLRDIACWRFRRVKKDGTEDMRFRLDPLPLVWCRRK